MGVPINKRTQLQIHKWNIFLVYFISCVHYVYLTRILLLGAVFAMCLRFFIFGPGRFARGIVHDTSSASSMTTVFGMEQLY